MNIANWYYSIVGWFLLLGVRHRIMKSVKKTIKDRHAMRQVLNDKDCIRRAVYRYQRMSDNDRDALAECRELRD